MFLTWPDCENSNNAQQIRKWCFGHNKQPEPPVLRHLHTMKATGPAVRHNVLICNVLVAQRHLKTALLTPVDDNNPNNSLFPDRITSGSVTHITNGQFHHRQATYKPETEELSVHRCITLLKTKHFPFYPWLMAGTWCNPAPRFSVHFIFVEAYFFCSFCQTLWTSSEKRIQSHSATCLHHSVKTRLKDWTEKMLRGFKEL